jgi:hypothetical protein
LAQFEGIASAADAVRRHLILNEGTGPDHLHERLDALTRIGSSPVDTVVNFIEMVYANPNEFPTEARELAADASVITQQENFYGHGENERGSRIARVLRGEEVSEVDLPPVQTPYVPPVQLTPIPQAQGGPIQAEEG